MPSSLGYRPVVIAITLALLFGAIGFIFLRCPGGEVSWCNYKKIERGMTLEEVEVLIGRGEKIERLSVPETPDGPVVTGETFFEWKETPREFGGTRIVIGFVKGKVIAKSYWEPSL